MLLSILNLTETPILISTTSLSTASDHQHISIQPTESLEKDLPNIYFCRRRAHIAFNAILNLDDPLWTTVINLPTTCLSRFSGSSTWKSIPTPPDCPWRLFLFRTDKHWRKLVVSPRRDLASFLSEMPDTLSLASLALPGTHDALAFYGYPVSQCQSPQTPLLTQLQLGIRVIDVRLAIVQGQLITYHGIYPQRALFKDILTAVHAFLTSEEGRRETIVMSIKQEDFAIHPAPKFSALVRQEMFGSPLGPQDLTEKTSSPQTSSASPSRGMMYLENRVPTLGEVRGKLVLFSRFGANGHEWEGGLEGMGIHPLVWPDSVKDAFQWDCHGTTIRTHDWYSINTFLSIPEKVQLASRTLLQPAGKSDPLNIAYFSAATFPLALPPTVALGFGWPPYFGFEGVNSRLGRWILGLLGADSNERRTVALACSPPPMSQVKSSCNKLGDSTSVTGTLLDDTADAMTVSIDAEPRIRGWALLDYFKEPEMDLVALLVECNWRGRKSGEEGWP